MTGRETALENVSFRLRSDLQWLCRPVAGRPRWIARDPLTTHFFYFSEAEKRFLNAFDGTRSLAELLDIAQTQLGQSRESCVAFIAALDRSQLVLSDQMGQGRRRTARSNRSRRRQHLMRPLQLLAIQIPLIDPTPVLDALAPLSRWLFSRMAATLLVILGCLLIAMLIGRWNEMPAGYDAWAALRHGDTIFLVVLAYVLMKSLHELSHGMACRRWGADCHEMGVLLLALTPCLYCDVSDTWKLPSRFQRAAVAAAGVFTEVGLAVIAGFIWLMTVPGVLHSMAFSVMVLGSLNTILLNANPLLRYDGYYILSDLWNVPNLAEQAREAVWLPLRKWLTRGGAAVRPRDAPVFLLGLYGVSSLIYRHLVLVLVLWGINVLLGMWGLSFLAHAITVLTLAGVLLSWGIAMRRGFVQIRTDPSIRRLRLALFSLAVVIGCTVVATYPLRHEVSAVGLVQRARLEPIYVQRTGYLQQSVRAGDLVEPNHFGR